LSFDPRLSPGQRDALLRFEELLATRAVPFGMIGEGDRDRIRERHIEDSLRAVPCMSAADRLVVDMGSGAGLPGIPLAIALPEVSFILAEARVRRGAFLEAAVDELGLSNAVVRVGRVEDLDVVADACLARAFGSATASWDRAERLLGPRGRLVYFAGAGWDPAEHEEAFRAAGIRGEICAPKQFNSQGPVVIMGRFSRLPGCQDDGPKQS
jgi:16S rRNA (guanine527-N7)-methyltransferase